MNIMTEMKRYLHAKSSKSPKRLGSSFKSMFHNTPIVQGIDTDSVKNKYENVNINWWRLDIYLWNEISILEKLNLAVRSRSWVSPCLSIIQGGSHQSCPRLCGGAGRVWMVVEAWGIVGVWGLGSLWGAKLVLGGLNLIFTTLVLVRSSSFCNLYLAFLGKIFCGLLADSLVHWETYSGHFFHYRLGYLVLIWNLYEEVNLKQILNANPSSKRRKQTNRVL